MSKSWRNPISRLQSKPSIPSTSSFRKPAFSVKPFAHTPSTSAWSSSSDLANMKNPSVMSSEELGLACVSAAREQVDTSKLWSIFTSRAIEIADTLEPRDIALILNGMSRTRTLADFGPKLVPSLLPTIEKKLPYFSSIQIAMLISAISKLPASPSQYIPPSLIKEIKSRVHEFLTPVEFSMLMTALTKLGISDTFLYTRLSSFIQSRMNSIPYHVRDLSVIAHAFACASFRDLTLFEKIYDKCVPTLHEATPSELARLISAFLKVQLSVDKTDAIIEETRQIFANRFIINSSTELVNTIFAFSSICEHHTSDQLAPIFNLLKQTLITNFSLLQIKDIASILTSFSRWKIFFSNEELVVLVSKLTNTRIDRYDGHSAITIVASLAGITHRGDETVFPIIIHLNQLILDCIESYSDWSYLARALVITLEAIPSPIAETEVMNRIANRILKDPKGRQTIDRTTRSCLVQILTERLGLDHDLVLALRGD